MNLRLIHAHVGIRLEDAEDWLAVMGLAMRQAGVFEVFRDRIMPALRRAALSVVTT